ncbi:MAG: cytochrome P450 [Caulobacterales bacterium]
MDGFQTRTDVPAHVPQALVRDYDWVDMQGETDPARHFAKLESEPDIFWTPRYGGHWVTTRYNEMNYIYTHPEEFSSRHATWPCSPFRVPLQEMDGDLHQQFRLILAPFFTPKKIGHLEAVARDLTIGLIDSFYARGECEFVNEFGQRMPIAILMSLLDVPREDREYLLPLSDAITRFTSPEDKTAAAMAIAQYMKDKIIPARRLNPGDDVFSAFMAARINGEPIDDDTIAQLGMLLIAAGLDTVASMLGFITWHLADHPEQRHYLRDNPDKITSALEEMLRRFSLANMSRVVTRDMEFNGVQFKKGEVVLIPLTRAGLDPKQYDNPEEVEFGRNIKGSLTFGRGPHQCIGSFLARTELRVFLQEWLKRIPDFQVKPGHVVRAQVGSANALIALPLVWTPQ